MSPVVFTLHVPSTAPHRDLAGEVAARYLEIRGAAGAAAQAFAAEVVSAVSEIAPRAAAVDLAFHGSGEGVDVEITGGGAIRRLRRSL